MSVTDELTLYCDADRRLPHTDPFDRQIAIGLGCFLELLSLAAAEAEYRADFEVFPEGDSQPRLDTRSVACVRFVRDKLAQRDPLFAHGLQRRSIAACARSSTLRYTNEPAQVADLRGKTWDALYTEMTTYNTAKESIDLMRIGRAEIEANPNGIDLAGAFIEGLYKAGMLRAWTCWTKPLVSLRNRSRL